GTDRADDDGAGPACQLGGQRTDRAANAVHEHRLAGYRAIGEHRTMGGDPWYAEACAHLVADRFGQVNSERGGDDGCLRSSPERPVGLSPVYPDAPAEPGRFHIGAEGFDDVSAVAVRDDPRERHRVP